MTSEVLILGAKWLSNKEDNILMYRNFGPLEIRGEEVKGNGRG